MAKDLNTEFIFVGVLMKRLLSGVETGGQFCLFENASEGASQTPIHRHDNDDETIYMIEGEMQAIIAGETRVVKAGETVFLPRGIAHQLMNVSGQPTRYLLLCTPPGFEDFVAVAGRVRGPDEMPGRPGPEDIARLKEAAPRFGITLLPDWP